MKETSAPYLLDGLADLPPAERRQAVSLVVLKVWETPQVLLGEIPATQALAAIAAIAAGLPGAQGRPWLDDRLRAAACPKVTSELAGRALCALDVLVGRDSASIPLQLHVSDGAAATALLDDLRDVLMDGLRLGW
ncbi:hypothetical protein GCM10010435_56870 [Winogradskya consettensis]|uniref:Uncharacterized protein n=2 Tax=Winogradskya TaxID=3240235 RepID=A0A919S9I3_9ACTN|nr:MULTISPECIES: hypothetical protein [Actinoplanes]GIE19295.1 hypothetical protein Ahu01nite_023970 [Actinoplanes humidus]GIM67253.1 hypothetical protein Aco04nite_05450 [Actinoplanes consettensis]